MKARQLLSLTDVSGCENPLNSSAKKKRTVACPLRSCLCPDMNGVVCSSFSFFRRRGPYSSLAKWYADQLRAVGSFLQEEQIGVFISTARCKAKPGNPGERTVRVVFQKSAVFRQKNDWVKKHWPFFFPVIFLPITLSFDDQTEPGSGALFSSAACRPFSKSSSVTDTSSAPCTTCALVIMRPSEEIMRPEPSPVVIA